MAGTAGSSLTAELNRLASTTGKAAQGAANVYAGTSGLGINAALNKRLMLTVNPLPTKDSTLSAMNLLVLLVNPQAMH